VAVAADDKSPDTFWLVMIEEKEDTKEEILKDGYGNMIPAREPHVKGFYLEKSRHPNIYTKAKKNLYFYKESVVYPFVQVQGTKKGYFISDAEVYEILKYVESNNLSSFF